MSRDRFLILSGSGLRGAAVGLSGVVLSLHLAHLGASPALIGIAVSLGLAGSAAGILAATLLADRVGRRALLISLSLLMALGGLVLALSPRTPLLLASALLGMVNGMGRDRGGSVTIEQAILPRTTGDTGRTFAFAWYHLVSDAGHAVGALLGALPAVLRDRAGLDPRASYAAAWALYASLCLLAALASLLLSSRVEASARPAISRLGPASQPIVLRFAALSALDSVGGGFLTSALVGYWFFLRFAVDEGLLGPLFCAVRVLNGLSHLGAAWLARRFGLVNTMVFTHLPSSLLLMAVPLAPNLPVAVLLFLVRESLVEMDVPTRQSYLMAVVRDEERTPAAGIVNLTRAVSWAAAPSLAGILMRGVSLSSPLLVGPGLKIVYDLLLWRSFRRLRPPEERNADPPHHPPCGASKL